MMVSLNEVAITVGFLLAYLVNFLFITTHNGWKYMFGVAAIPAFLQALGIALMPNSHHYLIVKGKKDKARKVLRSLRNKNDVEEEMEAIISSIEEQKSCRYVDLFSSSSNMRGRMVLGMTLVSLQQFSGNTNVLYYAPSVFQHFGYDSDSLATLVTVGLGIVKVLSTAVTLLIVDKVGRRSLLLIGCLLMATSITLLGIFGTFQGAYSSTDGCTSPAVYSNTSSQTPRNIKPLVLSRSYIFPKTNDAKIITENTKILFIKNKSSVPESLKDFQDNIFFESFQFSEINNKSLYIVKLSKNETLLKNGTLPVNRHEKHRMLTVTNNSEDYLDSATQQVDIGPSLLIKIISVTSLMIFICAYGMSYGPVTWLVLSEIFPGSLRGRAVSVATCINWGSNIVVSLTFLDILNVAGIGPTFVVYGFVCYAAAVFVFFCVPETKSKTLEEINKDLSFYKRISRHVHFLIVIENIP
ncbi:solute carrier family 2, facilitated glucose transporter member 10-like isoform X2 [Stegodyphus dumicola]|uniref:solute carrier family 2, facilitated glucose transporter member 10-like isoform X2 n=1 Tax=Stegodyphus dumicola TaxID=202533 RepID=UPI0015A75C11|nr:solute carrier family 2, facilitated glucose transporter member 10-like isoform X2 [Stegodyphus dumicola]